MEVMHYVFILRCRDGNLYTGWTTDPEKRLEIHNLGKGVKYTKGRIPAVLVYLEAFSDKGDALRREAAIKKLKKSKKLELIGNQEEMKGEF